MLAFALIFSIVRRNVVGFTGMSGNPHNGAILSQYTLNSQTYSQGKHQRYKIRRIDRLEGCFYPRKDAGIDLTTMRCRKLKHLARSSLYGTFASDDYIARRKEKNDTPTIQSRPICARCNRPTQVCVCLAMPFKALATSTRFVILQHPAEAKRRVTGTVPLIRLCLSNCRVVVMGDQAPGEGAMKEILGLQEKQEGEIGSVPLLLFPLDGAELLEDIAVTEGIATSPLLSDLGSKDAYKSEQHLTATPLQNWEGLNIVVSHNGSPEEEDGGGKVEVDVNKFGGRGVVAPSLETVPLRGPVAQVESQAVRSVPARTVVLVDGTWSQARGILHANPFLIPFTARTKIGGRGRSGGKKTCKQSTQSGEKG
ncbi:unnamed protein product, partial [Choristocarpus tenellus]